MFWLWYYPKQGVRVTVGTIIGLLASGYSNAEILKMYPYLVEEAVHWASVGEFDAPDVVLMEWARMNGHQISEWAAKYQIV